MMCAQAKTERSSLAEALGAASLELARYKEATGKSLESLEAERHTAAALVSRTKAQVRLSACSGRPRTLEGSIAGQWVLTDWHLPTSVATILDTCSTTMLSATESAPGLRKRGAQRVSGSCVQAEMNVGLADQLEYAEEARRVAEQLASARQTECAALKRKLKAAEQARTAAERRAAEGELVRRQLHNTILVCVHYSSCSYS